VERLLAHAPANVAWRKLKAAILLHLLEHAGAAAIYEELLREAPNDAGLHASLGHCLRIMGRRDDSIAAYRRAIALAPQAGEAYWNLANLKTYHITDDELEAMRAELAMPELGDEERTHFHFAIGKALEDREAFEESFAHYADGNRIRRQNVSWDADQFSEYVNRCKNVFTQEFFDARAGFGAEAADPVFVVGLPRSGSTLVEQILASHSAVEGTTELPQIKYLAAALARRQADPSAWPEGVADLVEAESRELGREYIERTRAYRKLGKPLFIDKTPNNFEQLGLIFLMLPRARVVDVRRQPMACGLSIYKHLFARGQAFSYSLEEIGRYYRDYRLLMEHFDAVLGARIHRVSYEALVQDPELETRRLLEYCRLPFEEACLRFHENPRSVSTPSSEQVRSPIFTEGLDHWRHYAAWLEPLERALPATAAPSGKAV
jgi:tetratricopeptide (TPR) repeat protein